MNRTSDCFSTLGHIIGQNIFVIFLGFLQVRLLNGERPRTIGLTENTRNKKRTWCLLKHPMDKNGCLSLWVSHQRRPGPGCHFAIPLIGGILTGR